MAWTSILSDQAQTHYSFAENARIIWEFAIAQGCTEEAAAGLLGNIEAESYCNPGQYEIGKNKSLRYGMGLIQWTPSQNYWDQYQTNPIVSALGSNWYEGSLQVAYIFAGDTSNWYATPEHNYSFNSWKQLNNIDEATRGYFYNRERGTWSSARLTYAKHWYDEFHGVGPVPSYGKFRPEFFLPLLIKYSNEIV